MPDTDFEVLDDGRVVETNLDTWSKSKEKKLYEAAKRAVSKITPEGAAVAAFDLAFPRNPYVFGPSYMQQKPQTELASQVQEARTQAYENSPSYLEQQARDSWYGRNIGTPFRQNVVIPVEERAQRGQLFSKLLQKLSSKGAGQ